MESNEAKSCSQEVGKSGKNRSEAGWSCRLQPPGLVSKHDGNVCGVDFEAVGKAEATRQLMQALGTRNADSTQFVMRLRFSRVKKNLDTKPSYS